jgi:hypothetical protein
MIPFLRRNELNLRRIAGIFLLVAGLMFSEGQVRADSWQNAATFRVSTEYDSNPAMTSTNQGAIWRALFEPGYMVTGKYGENALSAGLALRLSRASNKRLSPDQDNPSAFFNWLRPHDGGEFGISTRYAELATRDSGGVDATGRVPVNSTRTSRVLSGSWKKELSERSSLLADSAYEGVSFKGGTFIDYSTRSGGLRINYELSEQFVSFCLVTGSNYVPASGGTSSSLVDTILGLNWKDEYVDLTAQMGQSKVSNGDAELIGSVAAHYAGQRAQLTLNAGRMIMPSGMGGFVKSDQVRGGWIYALSENSNMGLDLERQNNLFTTMTSSMSSNITSTSSGVWIDRNLTALWRLRTYYLHRTSRGGGYESAFSNLIGLSLAYDNPGY